MKEQFISGIYNYCDRWCERCTFTSRCHNYEGPGKTDPEQLDINNKKFWDGIATEFTKAIELINKMAKEQGIDLEKLMTQEKTEVLQNKEEKISKATKQHELSKLCTQYQELVLPFFDNEISSGLVEKSRELVNLLHLGLKNEEEVVHTMANLGDCEEIIQWYEFLIAAKLQRALQGKMKSENWEGENGFAKDSDGSAKIAIIAVEKSMAAWARFYELLPASEDTALNALAILSRIKQKALEEFPNAMQFTRPGFDE